MYLFLTVLGLCYCAWAFSCCGEWGLLSSCSAQAGHCCGFSCCRAQALGCVLSCSVSCGILVSSSVQFICVQLFATPWTAACQASLSITNSRSLLKLTSIESIMPSNHLILSGSLPLLPSISIRVFSSESVIHIRWPKYWSFSFSISRSNEYSGLVSFKMDWLDLLPVQGTLKSLLQHSGRQQRFTKNKS